ncbi:MAG: glycosyltransferase family 4 protein [Bacteroidaceae bacterium]|nr:glycosyltransferase family 4 protein [Bacteroidaceae bacterium]
MKILHVITSLRTGGAEKLMVDMLPRMKVLGHEVDLCVFDGVRTPFYEELEKRGVKIISLGHSVYSPLNVIRLLKLMRGYDIVHAHNTACQYAVAIAGLWVKCGRYTTEHNTTNRRRCSSWKCLDRWMYGQYDKIVCISELTRDNLAAHVGEWIREKIAVVHNGIDVNAFESTDSLNQHQSKNVLMVSAFREQKDQKTLIRAISLLPDKYTLNLVGGGELELMSECENFAKALGVENRVCFWGIQTEVQKFLCHADVVVLSSHYEGLSLSSLEGMASGKPFIASDVEGLRDIVGGYGVLFPHEDAAALAREIQKLCEDDVYREEVVRRCQERARMFDIGVMVERYVDVYECGEVRKGKDALILPEYSIAIRTLGLAGEKFRRELESIARQTVKPKRVLVYIAEGYECPAWRVGDEEYIYVKKGMVAQRALRYDEVPTDLLLLLDDDVELADDSAERMLKAMVENGADCVGADTFRNQDMPLWQKLYAMATNLVFPHWDRKWAFKIHGNGSFSYLKSVPTCQMLPTQYVAGPCAMWRKEVVLQLHWEDEVWLDDMEFSYMDDTVESYKLYVNGGKMLLLYNAGVKHLNAQTASGHYHSKTMRFYTRARLSFCIWWRTIYELSRQQHGWGRVTWMVVLAYAVKACWLAVVNVIAGFGYWNFKIPYYYVKGIADGWKYVHSDAYRSIRSYHLS